MNLSYVWAALVALAAVNASASDAGVPKAPSGILNPPVICDPRLAMGIGVCPHPWFVNDGGFAFRGNQSIDLKFLLDPTLPTTPNEIFDEFMNRQPWVNDTTGFLSTDQLLALPGLVFPPSPGAGWFCFFVSDRRYDCVRETLVISNGPADPSEVMSSDISTFYRLWRATLTGDLPWPNSANRFDVPSLSSKIPGVMIEPFWSVDTIPLPGSGWSCDFVTANYYRCVRTALDFPYDGVKFPWRTFLKRS